MDVEIRWPRGENPRGYHQLPFRMLVPQRLANTFVAGRCASMTHGGQSSARVTGPCFAIRDSDYPHIMVSVLVVDSPYYATVDEKGAFAIRSDVSGAGLENSR